MEQYNFNQAIPENTANTNAFGINNEEISTLYEELKSIILPEIQENEKLMASSYESMVNDQTPLI